MMVGESEDGPFSVPIFLADPFGTKLIYWSSFYFPADFAPVDYRYHDSADVTAMPSRQFIRLECLLDALHEKSQGAVRVDLFLKELLTHYEVKEAAFINPEVCSIPVVEAAQKHGIFVARVASYGRTLSVSISRRIGASSVKINDIHFRPKPDGTIGPGGFHEWDRFGINRLFWELFKTLKIERPYDLFPPQSLELLLSHFEWSKLARMTNREARQARISLVRLHPALWDQPKDLATLLKKDELYSEDTGISQIVKFLPGLIKEADE